MFMYPPDEPDLDDEQATNGGTDPHEQPGFDDNPETQWVRRVFCAVLARARLDCGPVVIDGTVMKHAGNKFLPTGGREGRNPEEFAEHQATALAWIRSNRYAPKSFRWYCDWLGLTERQIAAYRADCEKAARDNPPCTVH